MTDLAMNYVVNTMGGFFSRFWSGIAFGIELASYARAAEQLRRLGYVNEADNIYAIMRQMKSKK